MALSIDLHDPFGQRRDRKLAGFDINLLPLNLSDGRNIGELSGLFLYTAPKKTEKSRQSDIFIVLIHVDNTRPDDRQLREWAEILSLAYFSARGSLTMGVSAAVKALADHLAKSKKIKVMPVIFLNIAVLHERSLLAAHTGPVNTTVISSDHVQNFCNEASLPLQLKNNELSFFSADVHSEDIILLCPYVPADWTNASIMEVASDSPLNAIRFLLDRSGGNLKAAVIQLKTGTGQILYRTRTTITANIKPEFDDKLERMPETGRRRSSDVVSRSAYISGANDPGPEKPLFRQRRSSEFFDEQNNNIPDSGKAAEVSEISGTETDNPDSLTGEKELPGSQTLEFRFKELPTVKKPEFDAEDTTIHEENSTDDAGSAAELPDVRFIKKKSGKTKKRNIGQLLLIIAGGVLIPLAVVFILFLIYSGRSQNQIQRDYLNRAVQSAREALTETVPKQQEALWTDTVNYASRAAGYGKSETASALRRQAIEQLDRINGGISTVYNYASSSMLPRGLNITEIAASGQYTYALDSTSGAVLRFVSSGSGLALDSSFSCQPGVYRELGSDASNIQVGPLVDFAVLPAGSPHSFVLAGVDAKANVLYCSGFTENRAGKLIQPEIERLSVDAVTFLGNSLYILDTQASAVWEYIYSKSDGFNFEPSNYYGSYSPYLTDAVDFTMYKDYAYFLRSNGTLLICDYTAYRPDCRPMTEIQNEDHTAYVDLSLHNFKKIMVNSSPDNSIYLMDSKLMTLLNISVKGNYIRYIVPNRTSADLAQAASATGFGITGQNRLLWSYKNDLYIGNMP